MSQNISWDDKTHWSVNTTEADLPGYHAYFTGNGRLGVRVGAMVLDWDGDRKELLSEKGWDFWGKLNATLLLTLARHGYDGSEQVILPAWNQTHLEIGGVEYSAEAGKHQLRNTLDLRNGEVSFEDSWEYKSGKTVTIKIRLVVPRSRLCAAWYEISLRGLNEPATFRTGLNAAQVADNFSNIGFDRHKNSLIGSYTTRRQGRSFVQGLRWENTGWEESGHQLAPDHAWLSFTADGPAASLTMVQSMHSSGDAPEPERRVTADLDTLDSAGRDQAAQASLGLWRNIWATGLNFQHSERRWERLVLINQFHLLANMEESGSYVLGPLGLSRPGWHGSQMWDADFWVFRGLLPLWPKLARSIVSFRHHTLGAARANAKLQGFDGAFYPWLCNDMGEDITSAHYRNEIHNNAWIGISAWEAAGTPPDKIFLEETAWPILEGIANFFVSRATRDADGSWHLRGVLPPDESVAEGQHTSTGTCDDNVLTNVGARTVLQRAIETAGILKQSVPPEWPEVADGLVVLPAGPDGVIPEYAGYSGHMTKQADTILAFYPLELEVDQKTLLRTQEYYHQKTDRGGPLMTHQIEALLTMLHGDREKGLKHLFTEYERYVRGPHFIPFETPENSNSIMLTGIGGLLQALIFGWYGANLDRSEGIPRIGDGWNDAPRRKTDAPSAKLETTGV